MSTICRLVSTATLLVFLRMPFFAQDQTTGAVSSKAPGSRATTNAPTSDAEDLPWKLLASPGGVLDPNDWPVDKIRNFAIPSSWPDTQDLAERLVQTTIGKDPSKTAYTIIHIFDYSPGTKRPDAWYLFRSKDASYGDRRWNFERFTGQRIYGSNTVSFLFVHLNVKAVKQEDANETGQLLEWFGEWGVPSAYANVHYECAVVKRTPANVANFLDILKVFGVTKLAAEKAEKEVILWGAGRIQQIGLPSNITIAGYSVAAGETLTSAERSAKLLGSNGAYNDEQLYWWDVSIGIPVNKFKDLQYSASDNTVVASEVDKQSAYAMFNFMPYPVDVSDHKSNVFPRFLLGFPFSGSPWDRLFIGGGLGIPLKPLKNFQIFAGVILDHTKQPATPTLTAGSPTNNAQLQNDLKIQVRPQFTFGISVPVKSVLDKLLK